MSQAYRTVAELVPVAEAALAGRPHDDVVRDIRRALLRLLGDDVFGACDLAAEAIVWLASDFPGYGDDLRPPGGKQL